MVRPVGAVTVLLDVHYPLTTVSGHLEEIVDAEALSCDCIGAEALNENIGTLNEFPQSCLIFVLGQINIDSAFPYV